MFSELFSEATMSQMSQMIIIIGSGSELFSEATMSQMIYKTESR
jgi:hypothetical protein